MCAALTLCVQHVCGQFTLDDPLSEPEVVDPLWVSVVPEDDEPELDASFLSEVLSLPLSVAPDVPFEESVPVEPELSEEPFEPVDEPAESEVAPPLCEPVPDVELALLEALGDGVELADTDGEALAVEDGSSSGRLCDLSSPSVVSPVSLGLGVGVTLVVLTMSRTTLSVPCPRVTSMMMPAVTPTATNALTTDTMMATRLFLRARSWDTANGWLAIGRPGFSPETMTRPWRPLAASEVLTAPDPGLTAPMTRVASSAGPITVVLSEAAIAVMVRVASPALLASPADSTAVSSPAVCALFETLRPLTACLSPDVSEPSACAASSSEPSLLPPATSWSFSDDALRMFWYSCEETAETIEPAATPITEPAMPILADSRNDVTAASAPATIWGMEIPLKKFFTRPTVMDELAIRWGRAEKSRHDYIPDACRATLMYRLRYWRY